MSPSSASSSDAFTGAADAGCVRAATPRRRTAGALRSAFFKCAFSGRHPVAVEAEGHPMRRLHTRDRTPCKIASIQDEQFAGIHRRIVPYRQNPSVVFAGLGIARNEHRLTGHLAAAQVLELGFAALEVAFHHAVESSLVESALRVV